MIRPPIPFSVHLSSRVTDFDCGSEPWESELSRWITAPETERGEGLWCIVKRKTRVWLYENLTGELVGYASLGDSKWDFPEQKSASGEISFRRMPIQIIPAFAIQRAFWGQPQGVPSDQKYSRLILKHVINVAIERIVVEDAAPILGLFVHQQNPKAIHIYRSLGFSELDLNEAGYVQMFMNINPAHRELNVPNE